MSSIVWTTEEDRVLIANYRKHLDDICLLLKYTRSIPSIKKRIEALKSEGLIGGKALPLVIPRKEVVKNGVDYSKVKKIKVNFSKSTIPCSPGFIYLAQNESIRGLKIGKTCDIFRRMNCLYSSSVPTPFEYYYKYVYNMEYIERSMHHYFKKQRINPKREFFNVDPGYAKFILENIGMDLWKAVLQEISSVQTCGICVTELLPIPQTQAPNNSALENQLRDMLKETGNDDEYVLDY